MLYRFLLQMLYRFLSYVVSFPTSEAVVKSWGSVIDHLNKNKPNTKEVIDNLVDTGTIDKLALNLMFQDDYSKHFLHLNGQNLKATFLVKNSDFRSSRLALLLGLNCDVIFVTVIMFILILIN